jgi:hypothetical protein
LLRRIRHFDLRRSFENLSGRLRELIARHIHMRRGWLLPIVATNLPAFRIAPSGLPLIISIPIEKRNAR